MTNESPYQKMLQGWLRGELRLLNAQLPSERKSLAALLGEEYPSVLCSDGTPHLFKRKELKYLADLVNIDEQKKLLLPILIEVNPGQDEIAIICHGDIEKKVITKILDMPLKSEQGRITIYKPQLGILRKMLKTTTQYVFCTKLDELPSLSDT
ncbi:MAG: DUF61 family protein [Dehalococcoidales bacterium]|nr:DUF61 family protein [Dehalococcoidales bacterium]